MKIIFNLFDTGLGNNGGSHTLVRSANTLVSLGHDVTIVDSVPNCYSWSPFKFKHLVVKNVNEFPNGDVVIATGIGSLKTTNECKIDKKFMWIRGWETWKIPEDQLVKTLKQSPTVKLVNGLCLQNKLKKFDIESTIVRPGYDFDEINPLNFRQHNEKIVIGGLFNKGKKRENKRTEWIINVFDKLEKDVTCKDFELWMMSSEGQCPEATVFMYNPTSRDKNFFYNKVDIWLATSELEGLHLAPAEAMMTECCVVGTNAEMAGTQDYLIDKETGLVSNNDFISFYKCVEDAVFDPTLRRLVGKMGKDKISEIGDRNQNMRKMMEILQK